MEELRQDEEAHRSEDEREFGTREQDGDSGEDGDVDGTPLLGLRALQSPSPTLDEHGQETPSEVSPAERRTPARRGGWAYVARPKWTAIREVALDARNILLLVVSEGAVTRHGEKRCQARKYRCSPSCTRNCIQHLGPRGKFDVTTVRELREGLYPLHMKRLRSRRPKPGGEATGLRHCGNDGAVGDRVVNARRSRSEFRRSVEEMLVNGASARPSTQVSLRECHKEVAKLRSAVVFDNVAISLTGCGEGSHRVCEAFLALVIGQYVPSHGQRSKTFRSIRDAAADRVMKYDRSPDGGFLTAHKTFSRDCPATMDAVTFLANVATSFASCLPRNQEARISHLSLTQCIPRGLQLRPHELQFMSH